jgi:hypothetical protein
MDDAQRTKYQTGAQLVGAIDQIDQKAKFITEQGQPEKWNVVSVVLEAPAEGSTSPAGTRVELMFGQGTRELSDLVMQTALNEYQAQEAAAQAQLDALG